MHSCNVLFLCETNTALSPLAEATVNHLAPHLGLRAFSAGRAPGEILLPEVSELFVRLGLNPAQFEPKSWDVFTFTSSPHPDVIVDLAAVTWARSSEAFSRVPRLTWPMADPTLLQDAEARHTAVADALAMLRKRIAQQLWARLETRSLMGAHISFHPAA